MKPILYIVIPCYNEEKVLPETAPMFLEQIRKMQKSGLISHNSKIMFVNDGSTDSTWDIIKNLSLQEDEFCGISQSRNRGHQSTLLAGLNEAREKCDITISIDCDGQDDISVMSDMVAKYLNGSEIVYGVRSERKSDTFFKRITAESFYKFLKFMGAEVVFNHADYRLISSKVLKEFADFKEVNLFLRGMVPLVGFKSSSVYYERKERVAGKSHYPLKKMMALAVDGVTGFSIKPLRMIAFFGIIIFILSVFSLIVAAFGANVEPVLCIFGVLSGINLIALGIVGEYIGKIYFEVKARPRYIISERTENEKNRY